MQKKVKLRKNDEVLVIGGKDRNAKGKVLRVFPAKNTVIVERINMLKKHTRANPGKQVKGGILEREAPIQISNLKLICPECGKPTRVGRKRLQDGTGSRLCRVCGASFN